jgi:hypothetical protein
VLQLANTTPFAATILLMPDPDGIDSLFTIVKGTFVLGERTVVADEQVPIAPAPQYHGEPDTSSIRVPADVSLVKPATDVLLLGHAYAPAGRATTQMDVALALGPLRKQVRVFGDRYWDASEVGAVATWPAPFEAMPLVWERAFGGADRVGAELHAEMRNPVGAGFRVADGEKPLHGLPLPNLEDPAQLIGSWKDAPPPACFAPVAAHWEPRRRYAGTYDEAWQTQRAPYLPTDFDPRFFQLAPPDLIAPGYLVGGEVGELHGVTPAGLLRFRLPAVQLRVAFHLGDAPEERPARLDTVIVEPDAGRLTLVWRAVLACDKQALRVRKVETSIVSMH